MEAVSGFNVCRTDDANLISRLKADRRKNVDARRLQTRKG